MRNILLLFSFLLLVSCVKTFDHSVYSAYVPLEDRDVGEKNIELLNKVNDSTPDKSNYKFALISDSHTSFNDLDDLVKELNKREDISFVIHGGDMTDGGLLTEFQLFKVIMGNLNMPYLTVIGNHDCLANGLSIYKDMYGEDDYSIIFNNCKFIFFNDVVWELNNREPDYQWLLGQLEDVNSYDHVFIVAHIPPFSDSFTWLNELAYSSIADTSDISMSIHGHHHGYEYEKHYNSQTDYLIIGSVDNRHYIEIEVINDSINLSRIPF